MPMTEAAIHSTVSRDLFIAMGEPLDDGAWAVRIYIKPFVVWLWAGAVVMAIGGIFSISDKRYRMAKVKKVSKAINLMTGKESHSEVDKQNVSDAGSQEVTQ
jgi:cytochrome c-type biogenesis protein CcmF